MREENQRLLRNEVVDAFKKTGYIPMQGGYFPKDGCACALGAVYVARVGSKPLSTAEIRIAKELDPLYGIIYRAAFARGFDGMKMFSGNYHKEIQRQGYEDGQDAWLAVNEAGLVPQQEVLADATINSKEGHH